MATNQTPDRVSFSYGNKVPGSERFSSIDLHLSYSTDILAGETAAEAMARARRFVLNQFNERLAQPQTALSEPSRGSAVSAARPSSATFNPDSPQHQALADEVFDQYRMTPRRRRYIADNILKGLPLDQVGPTIHAEQTNMKKSGSLASIFRVRRQDGQRSNWDGRWPREER